MPGIWPHPHVDTKLFNLNWNVEKPCKAQDYGAVVLLSSSSVCVLSCSVMSDSCNTIDCMWPARLLYPWDSPGRNTELGCISFSRGSSWLRNGAQAFWIAGRFFTDWAIREVLHLLMNTPVIVLAYLFPLSLPHSCTNVQPYLSNCRNKLEFQIIKWVLGEIMYAPS